MQHMQTVADLEQLLQLLGNHQYCRPGIAHRHQALPDVSGSTNIDAPCRLRDEQQLGVEHHLAPHDEFLQIAARKRCRLGLWPRRAHVIAGDTSGGKAAFGRTADETARHQPRAMGGQQGIVRQRHFRHSAAAQPFFRHKGKAQTAARCHAKLAHALRHHADAVTLCGHLTRDQRREFLLAVAGNACDADNLATADL